MNEFLYKTLVGAGLDTGAARALASIPHKEVDCDPRRPLREPGTPRDEVMFVIEGLLSKYIAEPGGRRQIVGLRFPGEGILPTRGDRQFGIQPIVRSKVIVGKAEDLDTITANNPQIDRFFFNLVQRETAINYEWLVSTGRRDSLSRVAHLLLETAHRSDIDPHSEGLTNPFTQQQIADITGQTSVNVNRVFAELEKQQLIRRDGRTITFLDVDELARQAGFQEEYLS